MVMRESSVAKSLHILGNLIAFYVGWFSCVLGAAWGYPWAGPVFVLIWVPLHLCLVPKPRGEFLLAIACGILGYIGDSLLVLSGALDFGARGFLTWPAPLWMVALWVSFATALNVSLRWLRGRYVLGALFGLFGGPLAYLAGQRLGAVDFGVEWKLAMIEIGVLWSIAVPVVLGIAERIDRTERVTEVV